MAGVTFVAQVQPPVAGQPGERSFDDPPVPAEFVTGPDAFAGDADGDAAIAEPGARVSLVIGLVRVQLDRLAATRAAAGPDRADGPDQGCSAKASLVFAADSARDSGSPPRSDRTWIFEPGLPRSTGLGPVREPPFRPHAAGVRDGPGPVDEPLAAEFVQDGPVESRPDPGCGLQPLVDGLREAVRRAVLANSTGIEC